jgi:class 3 adenylate cyclase
MRPVTRYAKGSGGHVAYQVFGEGLVDVVFVPDHSSNLEAMWDEPAMVRFFDRLTAIGRVICFDRRGTGVSDPVPLGALPTLEQWMDDIGTVVDAVGSSRVAVFGFGDGGPLSMLFAATHPQRTVALALVNTFARIMRAPDYPIGLTPEQAERRLRFLSAQWGTGANATASPGLASIPSFREWLGRYERLALSPGAFAAMYPVMDLQSDVRAVLPTIRVPTLVLHRSGVRYIRPECGRYLADHIPGARYVELPGDDYSFYAGDVEALLGPVAELLTGKRPTPVGDEDRVLATVLFTDIVDSTQRAAALGDRAWKELLERHDRTCRDEIARFRGREVATTGDGFLAAFDGPARGVRCALAIRDAVRRLGLEVRAGLHTGECEWRGESLAGIAVHIGARVSATAAPGEVLVSSTVKDLVAGSGLSFVDRGRHVLKGVDGDWQLFAAT